MTILITTFATWKYHQRYNSSDVLVENLLKEHPDFIAAHCYLLRRLPVNGPRASLRILKAAIRLRPSCLVLCGMGATTSLKIERAAAHGNKRQFSNIELKPLVTALTATRLSGYAGRYVCNDTYYRVLKAIHRRRLKLQCLFIHVPNLDKHNTTRINNDFFEILTRLNRLK